MVTNEMPWGGTINAPTKFRKGDSLSIVAVAKPGYIFSGWDGDHAGSENPLILNKIIPTLNYRRLHEYLRQSIQTLTARISISRNGFSESST